MRSRATGVVAAVLLLGATPLALFDCAAGDVVIPPADEAGAGVDGAQAPDANTGVDGSTDAPADAREAGRPVGGDPCVGDGAAFMTFDKRCGGADTACKFGLHQVDCCGSTVSIGFGKALQGSFDTAEAAWRQGCPACNCDPKPTRAEDGTTGNFLDVKVSCTIANPGDLGSCITHF